jgi:hypothetical protein
MEQSAAVLRNQHTRPTFPVMSRVRTRSPLVRTILVVAGFVVMAVSPLVGIIPGPGGIFVFAAGLVLILRNAHWARRSFARLKRRWPRFGHYADKAMRRRSFRRRQLRAKELALASSGAKMPVFGREAR